MSELAAPGLLAQLSEQLAAIVDQAGRAVYTVRGRRRMPGSGALWAGGYVVTADHVLHPNVFLFRGRRGPAAPPAEQSEPSQEAVEFTLTAPSGQQETATLLGRDPTTDLAVLKLSTDPGPPPELAPFGSVRPGHLALALARPTGSAVMCSLGPITAVGERWWTGRGGVLEGYVRADVTMYPGFSGGPLVDMQGRVIGLNSSGLGRGEHVAVPAASVDQIVRRLIAGEPVRRAYLGISSQPAQVPESIRARLSLEQESGLLITWVEPGSPADRAGLLMGDLLLQVGGRAIRGARDLVEALPPETVGKPLPVVVLRAGVPRDLVATPNERTHA